MSTVAGLGQALHPSLLQPSPHPHVALDAARRCGSGPQGPRAWRPCPRAPAPYVLRPGARALGPFSRGAALQKGLARAAQSWRSTLVLWGQWLSQSASQGCPPPSAARSRDKPPSSEDAWKGRWGVLSKADSPPLAPPWSPHRVWGSLLLPIPLSAESPCPWAPSRLSGRPSLVTAAVGRWASVGGAAAGRGPPPLPRCLGKLLRGTGALGSSEAPGLPRAALLAGGEHVSPGPREGWALLECPLLGPGIVRKPEQPQEGMGGWKAQKEAPSSRGSAAPRGVG